MLQIKTRALVSFAAACLLLFGDPVKANQPEQKKADPDRDYLLKLDETIVKAIKANPNDTPLRKLQKERCSEGLISIAKYQDRIRNGSWNSVSFTLFMDLVDSVSRGLQDSMDTREDKINCYEFIRKSLKEFEEFMEQRAVAGTDSTKRYHIAKAARIDAEIELLKLKDEAEKSKK